MIHAISKHIWNYMEVGTDLDSTRPDLGDMIPAVQNCTPIPYCFFNNHTFGFE